METGNALVARYGLLQDRCRELVNLHNRLVGLMPAAWLVGLKRT